MNPAEPEEKRGSGGPVCSVPHNFLHLLTAKLASTYFIYSPASLPEPPSDWTAFPWAWTLSAAQKNSHGRILCTWMSTATTEQRREEREGLMCCAQEARPSMEMHVSACLYMEAHISNTHTFRNKKCLSDRQIPARGSNARILGKVKYNPSRPWPSVPLPSLTNERASAL